MGVAPPEEGPRARVVPADESAFRFRIGRKRLYPGAAMPTVPVEPYPDPPMPVPPQPDIPPVKEPEPDRLPDEAPNPNPDENDGPPKVL